jgi:predicted ATP-grasp superfamily ATP-dependent carboligase
MRVLIAGISVRAAAESAARAGFAVTAIDAFADADQHPSVRALLLSRPFSAAAAAAVSQSVECDAVAYLSNFENHPDEVAALAGRRRLWGNPPAVLRRVRDPKCLERALRGRGIPVPEVRLPASTCRDGPIGPPLRGEGDGDVDDLDWLVKPLASGGGPMVRKWHRGAPVADDCYLQERIAGIPGSLVFVAAGGRTVPLGVSRQLVGDPGFGASGYRYCGNILAPRGTDAALTDAVTAVARAVAGEFGLVGVNGVDFIAHHGCPYTIEVNPRWTASMELVERACGISVFGAHAAACVSGVLPEVDLPGSSRAVGKAVVFARQDVIIGDTAAWLDDPDIRDVPRTGERIRAGRPVCTVFATGLDDAACYTSLVRLAARVYADLTP